MSTVLSVSVHDIVDSVLRTGDIDNRVFNTERMNEGTRLHILYQNIQDKKKFTPEFPFATTIKHRDYEFDVFGRADGLIIDNGEYTIVEIKTALCNLLEFHDRNKEWHLGQAYFYAYMTCEQFNIDTVHISLVYIRQKGDSDDLDVNDLLDNLKYDFTFTRKELQEKIEEILEKYCRLIDFRIDLQNERNLSFDNLVFPFENLRSGQQYMLNFAYDTGKESKIGFVHAPTGIGKTVSSVFPYLKLLCEENKDKLFYLTSKNSIKESCLNLSKLLIANGFKMKVISINSKEKMCLNPKGRFHCNPEECPYAKEYFNKINNVIFTNYKKISVFDMKNIKEIADDNMICPFELQLDLSNYADMIVCDYNYVFDKNVQFDRYFKNQEFYPYYLLIDECHNLPQRVRDCYSQNITRESLDSLVKKLKRPEFSSLKRIIKKLIKNLDGISSDDSNFIVLTTVESSLVKIFMNLKSELSDLTKGDPKIIFDKIYDLSFSVKKICDLFELLDEKYRVLIEKNSENEFVSFTIKCLDSREIISNEIRKFNSVLMFSGTLSPKDYYLNLLTKTEKDKYLNIPSPFSKKHRLVLIDKSINLKMKDRESSYEPVYKDIINVVNKKVGNYFVFLPSFDYLDKIVPYFYNRNDLNIVCQERTMNEFERKEFLDHFVENPTETTIGFIVLGGIFSEGIDMVNDRLIGCIIVSVGLPKLSNDNKVLKDYYDSNSEDGFGFTYSFPAINKVIQAAGRVIRSDKDKGVILFIDTRYTYKPYLENIKAVYDDVQVVDNYNDISVKVRKFWEANR